MTGLIPFNRRNLGPARVGTNFEDFYNVLDDFFSDSFMPSRNLLRDTFKIDIEEKDGEFLIEAELPGIKKEEIDLNIEDENLCITVSRTDESGSEEKAYIHRERRTSSMSRRIRLAGADLSEIKAKLDNGILTLTVPKQVKQDSVRKIVIE
ncbi:MAG: Hsp20/alpha crystallin family protein [Oscillospiraceae bacterium]|jgi:HSP20 family protein|nr:Hsp20/alpha crystallin family protein [Oscillospiraceae bacterium]